MRNTMYEWLKDVNDHECENKEISIFDDPKKLKLGLKCSCGEKFFVRISRRSLEDSSGFEDEQKFKLIIGCLQSLQGREVLANSFN